VPPKTLYHSPPQQDRGKENKVRKLVGQYKGSLIKQKQRPHVEAKENMRFIFHSPSAGDARSLPWKHGFSMHSSCSGTQML